MKTFLLIFIFALSLKAEPLTAEPLTAYNNTCIYNYTMTNNNINLYPSMTPSYYSVSYSINIYNQLLINTGKYTLDSNGYCVPKTSNYNNLGLTENQVLLSSLTGILIGFTILFFAIFLTIKVGSRK